jgi:tetratricopeptide (TPR) repeat protein
MKRISLAALAVFVLIFVSMSGVQAQSPQEILNQYITDLQKNPSDYALREKIIKHVQTMKQKPVMSTEAEKYEGRAEYAIKNAKNEADFLDAAKEYDKALLLAPWVSSYYFNQAIAYEKAGKPKEAKQSFEFYLLAAPDAQDARDVRKRIAGLEYAAEKAAKESSPQAVAAREQKKSDDWLKKLDGRRYTSPVGSGQTGVIDVRGKVFVNGIIGESGKDVYREDNRIEIQGRETTVRFSTSAPFLPVAATFIISEDGDRITYRKLFSDGDVRNVIYLWQR